ncbi:serine protease inhibitor Kazal-type 1-like [Haematobia irritans]|uniref:serine protease inhibitor Kazal-type 1-like n=1 Tax=Haematobia irritans TaxID=7368 RepID=UPI003F5009A3
MKFLKFAIFVTLALCSYQNAVLGIYCPCNLRHWDPVCGTNGITYVNRCEFECTEREYAKLGRRIFVAKKGACDTQDIRG